MVITKMTLFLCEILAVQETEKWQRCEKDQNPDQGQTIETKDQVQGCRMG